MDERTAAAELAFWCDWIATRGGQWPDDFAARLDPERPETGVFAPALAGLGGERLRVLDVGSGPLTSLGTRVPGAVLEREACDVLAREYGAALDAAGIVAPVRVTACAAADLRDRYPAGSFDAVHARNVLGLTPDPLAAVVAMLACVRPGGLVLLSHERNAAARGGGTGWNLEAGPGGELLFWHLGGAVDVSARLAGVAGVEVISPAGADAVDVVLTRSAAHLAVEVAGVDRPLLELVVVGSDPAAIARFETSAAAYVDPRAAVHRTVVPDAAALAALAPTLPARAHLVALLAADDPFVAPFDACDGAVRELAEDPAFASRALGGGAPAPGLRGRLVRAGSAPGLVARMRFDAAPRELPRAICVLGFHRSGTSMTTRLLSLLGVDLGPGEELIGAVAGDNPRGYFEPAWMVEVNDAVLAALGGSDLAPPRLAPGWQASPALDGLRERAGQLLDEKLAGTTVWGFKDPRTSLTLPFWQDLLAERVRDVRYVLCLRSPADTAASMLRRDYDPPISAARWGELWHRYTALACRATDGCPRLLVTYDDLLRDGMAEALRLAEFAGLPEPDGERLARLHATIEPDLRHHASTLASTAADTRLPAAARSAYLALCAAAALRRAGDPGELPDALERVAAEAWDVPAAPPLRAALEDTLAALQQAEVAALAVSA